MWGQLGQILLATGFGIASALIPVLNAEAFVIAVGAATRLDPVIAALGVSVGQTIGKTTMFCLVRYRPGFRERHRLGKPSPRKAGELGTSTRWGRFRAAITRASARLLDWLSHDQRGGLVVLLSGFLGFPPLYLVALVAGASRMRLVVFAVTCLVSRSGRFVLIALGVEAVDWHDLL